MLKYAYCLIIFSLLSWSCEEDCDCLYTILAAGEDLVMDEMAILRENNDLHEMMKSSVQFYKDSLSDEYKYRRLDELCPTGQRDSLNGSCNITYFITNEKSKLSIQDSAKYASVIRLDPAKRSTIINNKAFRLWSVQLSGMGDIDALYFLYEIQGQSIKSRPFKVVDGQLILSE